VCCNIAPSFLAEKILATLVGSKHLFFLYVGLTALALVFDVIALLMDIFGFQGSSHHTILLIVAFSFSLTDLSLLYMYVVCTASRPVM
jgi:hypothetical protein